MANLFQLFITAKRFALIRINCRLPSSKKRAMKYKYLSILPMLVLLSCSAPVEQKATNASSETSMLVDGDDELLRDLKTVQLPKAYDEQDTTLLGKLLHSNYQLVDDQGGTYSKNDEMSYVSQYPSSYDSFDFQIQKLDLFNNGTATIFGIGTMRGTDVEDGSGYTTTFKSTDSFVKEAGRWQAISSHVSGVKETKEGQ